MKQTLIIGILIIILLWIAFRYFLCPFIGNAMNNKEKEHKGYNKL